MRRHLPVMARRISKERKEEILLSHETHSTTVRETAEREGVSFYALTNWLRYGGKGKEEPSFIALTPLLTESTSTEESPATASRYLEITTSYGAFIRVPLV
jgi:transposase-like protein